MQKLIICKGLPGSGKSTFAKNWVNENPNSRIRVCRDDIRRMLGPYWVTSRENLVTCIENSTIIDSLTDGYDVIVDATNFKGTGRFLNLLQSNKFDNSRIDIEEKDFTNISLDECIKRDSIRPSSEQVGREVIIGMYNKYLKKNE